MELNHFSGQNPPFFLVMNYSDVRRWWSTLNDRGFICPVEKWSIVWSNWPIEYFWVFLNIIDYFWICLRIFANFKYFWIYLRISEYFSVVSWRRDPHCLTQLTDHQFLSPASSLTFDLDTSTTSWSFFFAASSKIQNGLEWTLLMYLEWKSFQLTSQSCRISRILHCGNQLMKL